MILVVKPIDVCKHQILLLNVRYTKRQIPNIRQFFKHQMFSKRQMASASIKYDTVWNVHRNHDIYQQVIVGPLY